MNGAVPARATLARPAGPGGTVLLAALLTVWVALSPASRAAGPEDRARAGGSDAPGAPAALEALVHALGDRLWHRRQAAQEALLLRGGGAADAVRAALASPRAAKDPELRHRLQWLLERLDPVVARIDILRYRLGPDPAIAASGAFSGARRTNRRIDLAPVPRADPPLGARTARSRGNALTLSWTPLGETIEVRVEAAARRRAVPRRLVACSPAAHRVDLRQTTLYDRARPARPLERRRELLVLRHAHGRRSSGEGEPVDTSRAARHRALVATLIAQARRDAPRERAAALEILGFLRVEAARPVFEESLDDPVAGLDAAWGLARIGDSASRARLERFIESGPSRALVVAMGQDGARERVLRAASALVHAGSPAGAGRLLDLLTEPGAARRHAVLATLSELAPLLDAPGHEASRAEFLDRTLSEGVLGQLNWRDPEVPCLVVRAIELVDPATQAGRARLRDLRRLLLRLAGGAFPVTRAHLEVLLPVWRRAAEALEPPAGDADLFAAVARGGGSGLLAAAGAAAERWHGTAMPPSLFEAFVDAFRRRLESSEPARRFGAGLRLAELSASLEPVEGRLAEWVRLLVAWRRGGLPSSTVERRLDAELARWTGLPSGRNGGTARWSRWASDPGRVAARERELLAGGPEDSSGGAPRTVWIFDFVPRARGPDGAEGDGLRAIDGRRLVLRPGESVAWSSPRGTPRRLRLERATARGGGSSAPGTWRLTGGWLVREGVPVLASGERAGEDLIVHRISDRLPAGRLAAPGSGGRRRRLVHVVPGAADPGDGTALHRLSPQELFRAWIDRHARRLPDELPSREVAGWLDVVDELRPPGAAPIARGLLRSATSPRVEARLLSLLEELGDAEAGARLRRRLRSGPAPERLRAVRGLCELGLESGRRALLELVEEDPPSLRSARRRREVLLALDRFLRATTAPPREAEPFVPVLLDALEEPSLRPAALRLLERVTGLELGAAEIRGLRGAQLDAALRAVADRVRVWRAERG